MIQQINNLIYCFVGAQPSDAVSDTEVGSFRRRRRGKAISFNADVHSDAEVFDLEPPNAREAGKSLQEAALETISADLKHQEAIKPRRMVMPASNQPVNYTRGVYRPQPVHWRGMSPTNASEHYSDSHLVAEMWGSQNRSGNTESEAEADTEDMPNEDSYSKDSLPRSQGQYIPRTGPGFVHATPEEENQAYGFEPIPGAGSKKVTIVEKKKRKKKKRDMAPKIMEPGPVDFNQYGLTAQLWMEQVDRKTVQKSKTMKLAIMPEGQLPPEALAKSVHYSTTSDDVFLPPQWVIARGRSLRRSKQLSSTSSSLGVPRPMSALSGGESDVEQSDRPMSPGRQKLLFFRVGGNWRDLAWVLFEGIQNDSETIRMLKDIQLKHPGHLTNQVNDMMNRWWKKKGAAATIEELQRALDIVRFGYLEEEYFDQRNTLTSYTDTEDELDISEISDTDPDVSRLIEEYDMRSGNNSFEIPGSPGADKMTRYNAESIIRNLNQQGLVNRRANLDVSQDSLTWRSRGSTRYDSSHESLLDESSDAMFVIVQPQLKHSDVSKRHYMVSRILSFKHQCIQLLPVLLRSGFPSLYL